MKSFKKSHALHGHYTSLIQFIYSLCLFFSFCSEYNYIKSYYICLNVCMFFLFKHIFENYENKKNRITKKQLRNHYSFLVKKIVENILKVPQIKYNYGVFGKIVYQKFLAYFVKNRWLAHWVVKSSNASV